MNSFIANIIFETKTPLKIGSANVDMLQDSPVQKDFNGLPMILGSSICGVLRREFKDDEFIYEIFGDDIKDQYLKKYKNLSRESIEKRAKGSRIVVSNALLCDENMRANESLLVEKSQFLNSYENLILRDHCAINEQGTSQTNAKFDEEAVYKGSRFKFRIELFCENDKGDEEWQKILCALCSKSLRFGGGGTKGFGEIGILKEFCSWDKFKITSKEYLEKSSSLNTEFSQKFDFSGQKSEFIRYELILKPDDFFIFGSGFGDDEADNTAIYERVVSFDKGGAKFSKERVLIPASSVKGAISHRSTFHLNLDGEKFIEDGVVGEKIDEIFGSKKEGSGGKKGRILMSDIYIQKADEKVFDHVAIDRFTGGAIDGEFFHEKTIANVDEFRLEILLDGLGLEEKPLKAFETALLDIVKGRLALGGATTKGHGFFSGEVFKNGVRL